MNRLFLRAAMTSCLLLGLIISEPFAQGILRTAPDISDENLGESILEAADSLLSYEGKLVLEGKLLAIDLYELEALRSKVKKSGDEVLLNKYLELNQRFIDLMRKTELSMLTGFTKDDWDNLRADYDNERDATVEHIESLTDSLVMAYAPMFTSPSGRELLDQVEEREKLTSDFNYRIGVLYLEQAELRYDREMLEWDDLLDSLADSPDADIPPEPEMDYSLAIQKFHETLDRFPDSDYVDDALYNLAYINTQSYIDSEKQAGIALLQEFTERFPESPYYPEVRMRLGEYYFNPPMNDMAAAIIHYKEVTKYPENPQYTNALYRLGWSYYRDNQYGHAVDYFSQTIDITLEEIEAGSYSNLMEESIENLSKSFATDTTDVLQGIVSAVDYLKKDPKRLEQFGGRMLKRIGDIFQNDMGEYQQAVTAFDTIMALFPYDIEAPEMQRQKIKCYEYLGDKDKVSEAKYELFRNFNKTTHWANAQTDPELVKQANLYAEKNLRDIVRESVILSTQTKQQDDYLKTVGFCRDYVEYFPQTTETYRINYNLAVILTLNLEDYLPACIENINVTRKYPDGKYHEQCATNAVECAFRLMEQEKSGQLTLPPLEELDFGLPEDIVSSIPGFGMPAEEEIPPEIEKIETPGEPAGEETTAPADVETVTPDQETEPEIEEVTPDTGEEVFDEGMPDEAVPVETVTEEQTEQTPDSEVIETLEVTPEETPDEGTIEEQVTPEEEQPEAGEGTVTEEETAPEGGGEEAVPADTGEEPEAETAPPSPINPDEDDEGMRSFSMNPNPFDPAQEPEQIPEETPVQDTTQVTEETQITDPESAEGETAEDAVEETPEETPDEGTGEEQVTPEEEAEPVTEPETNGEETPVDIQPEEELQVQDEPITDDSGEQADEMQPETETVTAESDTVGAESDSLSTADAVQDTTERAAEPEDELVLTPLTTSEIIYLHAVQNYIDILPDGEKTDTYLLNAGVIFHDHNMFSESRHYLQNLVENYPQSAKREEAYQTMLDGYFTSKDYKSTERLAKELVAMGGLSTELTDLATARVGESIYSAAKELEKNEDFLTAGSEYKRVAMETPDYKFADVALWESARQFTKATAWDSAVVSFELLVQKAPDSDWADKSINNVAFIYQNNIEDKQKAAETFERLYDRYPQSEFSKSALTNASVNYTELEDFSSALRVNEKYLRSFPDAEDAIQVLYENAELYLKMGDLPRAIRAFGDFTRKYPDDPRNIRAEYQVGKYYLEQNDLVRATSSFERTVQLHKAMVTKGQTGFPRFASFALNKLLEWKFKEFLAIDYSNLNSISANRSRKEALKLELDTGYQELISFRQSEAIQAIYNICRLDEDLASVEIDQAVPARSGEEAITGREDILAASLPLYITAASSYYAASREILSWETALLEQGGKLRERVNALETMRENDGFLAPDSQTVYDAESANLTEIDRSLSLSTTLKDSCKNKVGEIYYNDAKYLEEVFYSFVALPDQGGDRRLKMFYRAGILGTVITPRLLNILDLYRQSYVTADTVGTPVEWKDKSAQGAVEVMAAYIDEYHTLIDRPFNRYNINHGAFRQRVRDGDESAYDITSAPLLYLDFYKAFIDSMYYNGALVAEWANRDTLKVPIYTSVDSVYTDAILKYYDSYKQIAEDNDNYFNDYDEKFGETGDDLYFEGMDLFEIITGYVTDYNFEMIDNVIYILESNQVATESGDKLFREMVKIDPIGFGYLVGLSIDGMGAVLTGGEEWKVTTDGSSNFYQAGYDDSEWPYAMIGRPAGGPPVEEIPAIPDSLMGMPFDSTMTMPVDSTESSVGDTLDIMSPNPQDPDSPAQEPDTTATEEDFSPVEDEGMSEYQPADTEETFEQPPPEEDITPADDSTTEETLETGEEPVTEGEDAPVIEDDQGVTEYQPADTEETFEQPPPEEDITPADDSVTDEGIDTGEETFEDTPLTEESPAEGEMLDMQDAVTDTSAIPMFDQVTDTTGLDSAYIEMVVEEPPVDLGPDMSALDALMVPALVAGEPAEKLYYRRVFTINGRPVSGVVTISADNSFALFVNGHFIGETSGEGEEYLTPLNYTVTSFLAPGENVIGIELNDPDLTGEGLWFKLDYSIMPDNIDELPIVRPGEN